MKEIFICPECLTQRPAQDLCYGPTTYLAHPGRQAEPYVPAGGEDIPEDRIAHGVILTEKGAQYFERLEMIVETLVDDWTDDSLTFIDFSRAMEELTRLVKQ